MNKLLSSRAALLLPGAVGAFAVALVALWLWHGPSRPLALRAPGTDQPAGEARAQANPVLAGKLIRSGSEAGLHPDQPPPSGGPVPKLPGAWPQFRGANRDGISRETQPLLRAWAASGPAELWSIDVGEGYAGAAVLGGRVYLMDYDQPRRQDALRCLSLADGREIWRYVYSVSLKRNHGLSRTIPAVSDQWVVGLGPKCHVVCVDAATGELRWGLDLVRQYGTTVPPWYAGQCPLLDRGAVVLAPGGPNALLLALDGQSGQPRWQTPNPHAWKMTHSSIVPMEFAGQRMYVYCANNGVVGVSADTGAALWETADWKISLATVASPLILEGGRIFLSGGYNAGSLMLQLKKDGNRFLAQTVFRLEASVFGATQHTPILFQDHIYGVRPDGRFVCLDLEGKTAWASGSSQQFGQGPFILADGLLLAMNDSGVLRLIQATPDKYALLAQAQVLKGHESWGPLALASGRLLARDLTRMVCLDVGRR
ncbi:MAG TPA: PQQ-binding-like beta-propeller repeat protein [Dongiaceae bacterium]|nr:PQQ-binding-like beta-propeller repeat protein [Dongiaceae bacterium]